MENMTKLMDLIKDDEPLTDSVKELLTLIDETITHAFEMGYGMGYKAGKRNESESKKKR